MGFVDDIMAGSSAARQSKTILARFWGAARANLSEQSGLLTHITATEGVSLYVRMKS